ncbi:unnamed protein product [Caenorhabditis sp. 36 PRJEB53466]|nr:unnamed protein product [Caenorhabditis sp. 36 PRJEB53466]
MSSSAPSSPRPSSTNPSREQTTGAKLIPPQIRVERCRCVTCGGAADLTCKECRQETVFCKKCARRAKHPHPLKAFRRKDEDAFLLRKHLTLSYYEHIVACTSLLCMETCMESRYARDHFQQCSIRPHTLMDITEDGEVRFDATTCNSCGLFLACMFMHADKCHKTGCPVVWCDEIRATFEMGMPERPVYLTYSPSYCDYLMGTPSTSSATTSLITDSKAVPSLLYSPPSSPRLNLVPLPTEELHLFNLPHAYLEDSDSKYSTPGEP